MKPVTPQEFAQVYGVFIADMLVAASDVPAIIAWFNTNLPDVALVYKTNPDAFAGFKPSITSFPRVRVNLKTGASSLYIANGQKLITNAWTAITIDLKAALAKAEVDPNQASLILASFAKLKPVFTVRTDGGK